MFQQINNELETLVPFYKTCSNICVQNYNHLASTSKNIIDGSQEKYKLTKKKALAVKDGLFEQVDKYTHSPVEQLITAV